jgi:hypothetical protein
MVLCDGMRILPLLHSEMRGKLHFFCRVVFQELLDLTPDNAKFLIRDLGLEAPSTDQRLGLLKLDPRLAPADLHARAKRLQCGSRIIGVRVAHEGGAAEYATSIAAKIYGHWWSSTVKKVPLDALLLEIQSQVLEHKSGYRSRRLGRIRGTTARSLLALF